MEDQHAVYNDEEDDEESVPPHNEEVVVDEDDDDEGDSPSDQLTIAVVGDQQPIALPPAVLVEENKPSAAFDDSRKLFQRLWTDEDEIELLQGFLEYTTQRGGLNSSSHHHDTTAFYDQIKTKLQLDFNKNQLVEKLRRLKKKYRNVMSKMASGKEFLFKSSHDQAAFEISRKIWTNAIVVPGIAADGGFDDEDSHLNLNANFIDHIPNGGIDVKTPKSRKRSRGGAVKAEEKSQHYYQPSPGPALMSTPVPVAAPQATTAASIPSLIEETVRSCLSPIFKELLNNVTNLNGSRSFGFGMSSTPTPNPTPLGFGSSDMMMVDEKWRKQHMLELEVYSRRLELVQDQIKAQLKELRSKHASF